jgi:hypothetical protein
LQSIVFNFGTDNFAQVYDSSVVEVKSFGGGAPGIEFGGAEGNLVELLPLKFLYSSSA